MTALSLCFCYNHWKVVMSTGAPGGLAMFRTLDNERELIEIEQRFQRKMFEFKIYFILGKLKPYLVHC